MSPLDKCDFYKARQTFFTTPHCMICHKNSPLVHAINKRFLRYHKHSNICISLLAEWLMLSINCVYLI